MLTRLRHFAASFAVAAFLAALTGAASAQTAPGWTYGYVPTQAEWNAEWASKQDYLGAPPLLTTGGSMIGRLVTAASTTSAAGLNVGVGVAPTSPVNGDIWVTSTGMFVQVGGSAVAVGGGGRTILAADIPMWVRNDGNANCTGLVNAAYSFGAFPQPCAKLTWNTLYTAAATTLDFAGHAVTLTSGTTNTYTSGLTMAVSWVGGGALIIDLKGSNIADATTKGIINNASQPAGINITNSAGLGVGGNISSTNFSCIQNSAPVQMGIGAGVSTGPCGDAAYEAIQGGLIALAFPVNSIGAGGNEFVLVATGGQFGFNGQKINHRSNQTYSLGYAVAQNGGILANSATFDLNPAGAGGPFTITGPRYNVTLNGSIYTGGAGVNFFPGTTAGAAASDSGGCYDSFCYGSVIGHASLDLALTGGTMSGGIDMGSNAVSGLTGLLAASGMTFRSNGSTTAGILTASQTWGFGTTTGALTPTNTQVVISKNVTAVDAATPGLTPLLHVVGADSTIGAIIIDGFGQVPGVGFRRANGTAASPTVVTSGSVLGSFFGLGLYATAPNTYGYSGEIDLFASETWSSIAHGGGIKFWSNPNGSVTQSQSMTLQQSGGLSIGAGTADPGIGSLLVSKTYGAVPTTFGSLVTCNAAAKGFRAFITDELAAVAFNTAATGGGANNVPVFCDGAAWRIG